MKLSICEQFTDTPGGRYISEGPFSGEEFRNKLLQQSFEKALAKSEELVVDLDGGFGYCTSFLEEAFGGLARIYGKEDVKKIISIKSEDEPSLKADIDQYIEEANSKVIRKH